MNRSTKGFIEFLTVLGIAGCTNRNNGNDIAMVREILELAQHDRVQGSLKVHVNGEMEAGIKEGVYFGSPGTIVQADLSFIVKDVKPAATSQPADNKTSEAKTANLEIRKQ